MSQSTEKNNPEKSPQKKSKGVSQLGDFKLLKKLGQGGMGTVYLAKQLSLDRQVALKTLNKEFAKKEDFVQRFLRESRSMAKLQHPNIVQVYAADSQAGFHFAAIEFIDGQSMQDWMDSQKKLSVGDALHVTIVCADALLHAHELGMIHRDIKPDNILVTKAGIVKVADFGLAKAMDDDVSVTKSGTGLGTPLYMPPEQARDAKYVDQRSDIYALGSTLYYFLTGQSPFAGENTLELIMAKEKGQFKPAKRINADVPERLDLIIDKMLARKPEHRYTSCKELLDDLQQLGRANQSLTFLGAEAAGSTPRLGSPATQRFASTQATTAQTPAAQTRPTETNKKQANQKRPDQNKTLWFVQYADEKGKIHMTKMDTAQLAARIRSGKIGPKSKAKKSAKAELLPVAQFAEFTALVEKQILKTQNRAKTDKIQGLYQEVDDYERKKKRWRWLKRLGGKMMSGVGLIIWLALIAAGILGVYFLFPFLKNWIGDSLGLQ